MALICESQGHCQSVRQELPANSAREVLFGGEGGIRTREPLRVTRFPSVRAKPATRPLRKAGELYHKEKWRAIVALHQVESYYR